MEQKPLQSIDGFHKLSISLTEAAVCAAMEALLHMFNEPDLDPPPDGGLRAGHGVRLAA